MGYSGGLLHRVAGLSLVGWVTVGNITIRPKAALEQRHAYIKQTNRGLCESNASD